MSETIDAETTGPTTDSGSGGGGKVAVIVLSLLLVAAIGGAGALGWLWSEEQKKVLTAETKASELTTKVGDLERERDGLTAQLNDSRAELNRERADRLKEREQLLAEKRDELQRAYAQFNEIVYDSRKTLEYIGTVEDKLKTGKALSEKDAADLRSVVTGMEFLQRQYSKPIQEFRELERFLADQLAAPAMVAPGERYGLLKRIFNNDDYKRDREAFFKDQGQREAFDRARVKVQQAYANAQAQMKAVTLDTEKYLDQLDAIANANTANAKEIQEFFAKSREILKIHDKIMSLEPEKELQGVRP
ncbi:MAG: hypothetical protein JNK37_06895 [Verrucomicrobiales bacterium]|nr:hypothetical protein [Verrucomicrobiales bacterium]